MTRQTCCGNTSDLNSQLAIAQFLEEGNVRLAWHVFLASANNIRNPCSIEILVDLLNKLDAATFALDPIPEEMAQTITEAEFTHNTSNKLENALSLFVTHQPRTQTYLLGALATRLLRLHKFFGEPTPRSKTARELQDHHKDLCTVHIHA